MGLDGVYHATRGRGRCLFSWGLGFRFVCRGQAMEGPVTRIQAGGCCRAVGTGLDYPHMLSAVVRVVWGRSLRERHMTGPLTGKIPPEADFQNRRPGASAG